MADGWIDDGGDVVSRSLELIADSRKLQEATLDVV